VECAVIETSRGGCDCNLPGRQPLEAADDRAVLDELDRLGLCGGAVGIPCEEYCMCELRQAEGAELDACQNLTDYDSSAFCYVDPENFAGGNELLVDSCPRDQRRLLRLPSDVPRAGAVALLACPAGS
jgi:hypothetical protein